MASEAPATLGATADIVAYLGIPEDDSCHTPTVFGTLEDAERGCGPLVARNGVEVSPVGSEHDAQNMFIANGRNPLFIRTHFEDVKIAENIEHTTMLSLRVTTESSEPTLLCDEALVTREQFIDGIEDVAVSGLGDPKEPYNPATLWPGELGNIFYIVPFALSKAERPPYPELTVVLAPILVHEQRAPIRCKGAARTKKKKKDDSGLGTAVPETTKKCYDTNVTTTRLDTISFKVSVRTERTLEPTYRSVVDNCFYALEQSHARYMTGRDVGDVPTKIFGDGGDVSAAAASTPPASFPAAALAVLCATWLTARGAGRRR
uniref:Uncharacterized protein n=1 Tax=Haptolina ericina TaxID=156174 RepID=A0A7S3FFV8_9EUKA|mmetsp:Transcript_6910/g.15556  ORF Transcript_6910/g.15556 Transcript_6910/m.15556 type:complete len:319 (+) Transcript_6910:3-959(+)